MFMIASDLIVARVAGDLDIPPLGLSFWRCSVRYLRRFTLRARHHIVGVLPANLSPGGCETGLGSELEIRSRQAVAGRCECLLAGGQERRADIRHARIVVLAR